MLLSNALVGILLIICGLAADAHALQIRQTEWNGHQVLLATGEVEQGDAQRMAAALAGVRPLPHGLPVILLNSNGGSVAEALKISEVLSHSPVHTVIPAGARCASACASIIFVSGTNRTVENGGFLGQHSCSHSGIQDQQCNEMIAAHAITKGVSHGSIAAFMTYAGPEDMVWHSREDADCWGITYYPYTSESGFEKSEPCVNKIVVGRMPKAQSAWRVDFKGEGYRAFLRPATDHLRELELNLFCDDEVPGTLFLSMDIAGSSPLIKDAIVNASLTAHPISHKGIPFSVSQISPDYSRVTVEIKREEALLFLTKSNELTFALDLKEPYKRIHATTFLSGSRKALLFAANHCINPSH